MKRIPLLITLCVLISPTIVNAKFFYCPVIIDQGQLQQHMKWQMKMADWNSTLGEELSNDINSGQSIESAQKNITGAIRKSSEGYISAISAAFKQHAISLAVYENGEGYYPFADSIDGCAAGEETVKMGKGDSVAQKQYVDLLNTVQSASKQADTIRARKKFYKKLADPEENTIEDSGRLFPLDNNISEEEAGQIAETIIVATDPLSSSNLIDDHQKNVRAGQKYMATKKVKDAHVSFAQQALADIVSKKIAVYDMKDWAEKVSPLVASQLPDGLLSADQILDIQVGSRYNDPNRTIHVHRLKKIELYRELVAMKTVRLEFSRRILRHTQKEVFLTASAETLSTNIEMLPQIDNLRNSIEGKDYGN